MRHKELWLFLAAGGVITYAVTFVVVYVGLCAFMEDTAPA